MKQIKPPVVTILGHVDHGKTTLLDYIRKSSVASTEHGGITQHIGAYQVRVDSKGKIVTDLQKSALITFLDTPGHAAFEKMRSRGAKVADIAILVVAVDDGIMPQTVESINHIKDAKIPMIIAINKIDLPDVNIKVQMEKIKKQLTDRDILIEEYGGDVPVIPLSAKSGEGVEKLLEMILLIAEMNEFRADPTAKAEGVVIEANLDKFKGAVATVLIRDGSLRKGDLLMIGGISTKVRGLFDFTGKPIHIATPSTPVEVIGLEAVPKVGAILGQKEGIPLQKQVVVSLVDRLKTSQTNILGIVLKADKVGSLEAIQGALETLNPKEERIKIIYSGTGDVNEADVKLADATKSIVIGFNCKIPPIIQKLAENEHVLVRTYNIIYTLLDEIQEVVEGILKAGVLEEIIGVGQILAQFPYGKNEKIAGCKIIDGQITKGARVRILRGEDKISELKVKSIKKGREEATKVDKGEECGILFDSTADFKMGDIIQSFRLL